MPENPVEGGEIGGDLGKNKWMAGDRLGRKLDRSAHSFISRLLIKSQGTELERIEQYDVMAAMVNDVLYSPE